MGNAVCKIREIWKNRFWKVGFCGRPVDYFLTTYYNEHKRASAKSMLLKYVKGAPI